MLQTATTVDYGNYLRSWRTGVSAVDCLFLGNPVAGLGWSAGASASVRHIAVSSFRAFSQGAGSLVSPRLNDAANKGSEPLKR